MNTRHNVQPARLIGDTLKQGQGELSSTGALVIQTGRFTGRSPHDRYLVRDDLTRDTVDWGAINQPLDPTDYAQLYQITMAYAELLDRVFVRDVYACASPKYRLEVRVYTEYPWQSLFVHKKITTGWPGDWPSGFATTSSSMRRRPRPRYKLLVLPCRPKLLKSLNLSVVHNGQYCDTIH